MLKKMTTATTALLLAGVLAGCSAGETETTATPTPTPTLAATPTLKVPEKYTGSSVPLLVNGGQLESGTTATVYRFPGGWDGEPATCDDNGAETREITINGEGEDQQISFPVTEGVVSWVLVAGDFTTECGGEGSTTTVLIDTDIDVSLGSSTERTPVGQPKEISIVGKKLSAGVPATATVDVLGPWATLPEQAAAGCEDADVAFSDQLQMIDEINKVTDTYATQFTPTKAGVYQVVVRIPETAQSTEVDTCADGTDAATFVVAG
jgi:hypothetical protein